jgi:NADPH:quinone reductase-like Zn-dependent oxidoreductase
MSSVLKNEAAWVVAEKAYPMEVKPGPTPNPSENEIVIKVAYAAVNPTDYKVNRLPYLAITC